MRPSKNDERYRSGYANVTLWQLLHNIELLGIELRYPTTNGRFAEIHVPAYLTNSDALASNHLDDLQLEAGVKCPSRLAHLLLLFR